MGITMEHWVILISSPNGDRIVGPFPRATIAWDEWNIFLRPNLPVGSDAKVMPVHQPFKYGGSPLKDYKRTESKVLAGLRAK